MTVPCIPLMDEREDAEAVRFDLGQRQEHPVLQVLGEHLRDEQVGTCVRSMPRTPSALPGWSPVTSKTPSSSIATSGVYSSRAIAW